MDNVPDMLRNRLGITIAQRIYPPYNYPPYKSLLNNRRSRRIYMPESTVEAFTDQAKSAALSRET